MSRADDQLREIAEAAAHDIKGDHPSADVNYDMYIESLNNMLVGVIDMGENFQAVFVYHDNSEWEQTTLLGDPYDVTERILQKRSRSGW